MMICPMADKCICYTCTHRIPHKHCDGLSCLRHVDNKWPHVCIPLIIDIDDLFSDVEV